MSADVHTRNSLLRFVRRRYMYNLGKTADGANVTHELLVKNPMPLTKLQKIICTPDFVAAARADGPLAHAS